MQRLLVAWTQCCRLVNDDKPSTGVVGDAVCEAIWFDNDISRPNGVVVRIEHRL